MRPSLHENVVVMRYPDVIVVHVPERGGILIADFQVNTEIPECKECLPLLNVRKVWLA